MVMVASDTRGVRHNLTVYCSGREETRSETEKLCSHNLQSGHLTWWSADNCGIFPIVNILEARNEPAEKMIKRVKINIISLCFTCISYLSFGIEIARETVLNLNQQQRARSICRLHRFCPARTSDDYRIYDADKNYWRKCQIYRK